MGAMGAMGARETERAGVEGREEGGRRLQVCQILILIVKSCPISEEGKDERTMCRLQIMGKGMRVYILV